MSSDLVDVIARAIGDPGSVTPRLRDDAHQYLETVPRWSARAVTLVLADRDANLRAEIERLRADLQRVASIWTGSHPDRTRCAMCFSPYIECPTHGGA